MNHRVGVSVLYCFADLAEELKPALDGAVEFLAIVGDRHSFYVLHDEPRSAVGKSVGIVEAGDGWMIELRLHALFAGKAFAACGREPCITENLDCDQVA